MTNELETIGERLSDPATPLGALLYGAFFVLLAWLSGRTLGLGVRRVLSRPSHTAADLTAIKFLGQLARLGVYLFAFLTYAHLVPALRGLGTAWLASVGVVSVVFGLAAQNTLGNLIAGISLLLYRPFNLGDRLQVMAPSGLELGVVESLNLGYTILRTPDNRRIVIPNSTMASQTSVNLSQTDQRVVGTVPFSLSDKTDLDKARKILVELGRQHPKALQYIGCPVTALGSSCVILSFQAWCVDQDAATGLKCDLFETAQKRFKAEGIELYYPALPLNAK